MRGSYQMMDWEKTRVTNMVARALQDLEKYKIDDINFTHEDVNPYNLKEGLEALGYELSDSQDNGYNFWWYFTKENEYTVCVFFNARTFGLNMSLCISEDEEV
jgi:hypothetical protein